MSWQKFDVQFISHSFYIFSFLEATLFPSFLCVFSSSIFTSYAVKVGGIDPNPFPLPLILKQPTRVQLAKCVDANPDKKMTWLGWCSVFPYQNGPILLFFQNKSWTNLFSYVVWISVLVSPLLSRSLSNKLRFFSWLGRKLPKHGHLRTITPTTWDLFQQKENKGAGC